MPSESGAGPTGGGLGLGLSTRVLGHTNTAAKPPDVMRKVVGGAVGIKPNTRIELSTSKPQAKNTVGVMRTRPRRSLGN